MNAATAFEHRKELLLARLGEAKTIDEAVHACRMALEQTACELAQDEQDDYARQRQQAVMALCRRVPAMLCACTARGELVVSAQPVQKESRTDRLVRGAKAAGAFLLAALAVFELIDGRAVFACLQLLGGGLLAWGLREGGAKNGAAQMEARAIPVIEAERAVQLLAELCQAADVCVSDLQLLDQDRASARLSGTADEAMIDLLVSLMEAKASGRSELAMRSLAQAEQYLRMLGIELIEYDPAQADKFDLLPTMGEARTIRPALLQDGKLLRRGAAACPMSAGRGVGV